MGSEVSSASPQLVGVGILAALELATSTPTRPSFYRVCTVCGHDIPKARLEAQPNATLCVPCLKAQGDVLPIRDIPMTGDNTDLDDDSLYARSVFQDNARSIMREKRFTELDEHKFPARYQ